MSRRALDSYTRDFIEGGGRLDAKFFGEDVNEFTREELLGMIKFLGEELNRRNNEADRVMRFHRGLRSGNLLGEVIGEVKNG